MTKEEDEKFPEVYEHLVEQHLPPADPFAGASGRIGGGGGNKGSVPGFFRIGGWLTSGGQTMTPAESWTRIAKAVPIASLIVWTLIGVVLVVATILTVLMLKGH